MNPYLFLGEGVIYSTDTVTIIIPAFLILANCICRISILKKKLANPLFLLDKTFYLHVIKIDKYMCNCN